MRNLKTSWHRSWARSLGALGLAGAMLLGAAAPALADPGNPTPPDSGARPNPSGGAPQVPGQPGTPGQPGAGGLPAGGQPGVPGTAAPQVNPPPLGPLASQITVEQQAVEMLGERLKETTNRLADLRKLVDSARRAADAADQAVERTEGHAESMAAEVYRDYVAMPEQLREFASGLEHLAPGLRDNSSVEGKAAADSYQAALDLAKAAHDALRAAEQAIAAMGDDAAKLRQEYEQRSADLRALQERNADALRQAERAANRYANGIGFEPGKAVHGLLPNPKAVKAVKFALSQVGKPYVWGNEGPDSFDCSGLVWAAYKFAGVTMQARTARAQYYSTRVVSPSQMLPGDLVFFGPNKSDPESIHHVGIYIGGSNIVHAPTAGDKVKISPIWWWEFFAATRVVPAVKAPNAKPKPKPTPTPKPTAKPTPGPTTPTPGPSSSTSPRPTPSASSPKPPPSSPSSSPPAPSSEPPASATPSGSPSPAAPDAPCPTISPSPSGSPSPTESASPSPDPCGVTPASALSDLDGGTDSGFNWVFLDPFQKPATIAGRRRTRLACNADRRRRVT
ncbi:MAG TPA: NlpC/P60 family protein [Micromonosporaceae bacterium]